MPRYYTEERLPVNGFFETTRRPTRPQEMPLAFFNTQWGKDEACGVHEDGDTGNQQRWPTIPDHNRPVSERTLPSSGRISSLSKARDENYLRLCDRAQKRNMTPPTREQVLRHPDHDPPPPITPRSSSRRRACDASHEHQEAVRREAAYAAQSARGNESEPRWGLVNARRPTYAHGGSHRECAAELVDISEKHDTSERRPRALSEFARYSAPPQPLRRCCGRASRPSWW
ncbi:hypothetical protein EV356DRAFT_516031 [Viridothelium virens]|uniref:Uncharacterized protein n=1 Tax=Viridothelium virens TaxID=1048519 RepID=A0A6A6H707_VIRVR|nr:hypothetical protein EV356DRAFT_516031 [Viridothelium virens]